MAGRNDISENLVHFTTGEDDEEAYDTLSIILDQRRLLGSGEKIRGGFPCVCFSEAPLES